MRTFVASVLLLTLCPWGPADAGTPTYAVLQQHIDGVTAQQRAPSIVAVVFDGRHILWSYSAGYSDPASKTVPGLRTRYRLGSMAKAVTSTVLALAEQRRLVRFAQQVQVRTAKGPTAISLEQLVNMKAGLAQAVCYQGITGDFDPDCDTAFDSRFSVQMTSGEGRYSYSNIGPQLAAEALAARMKRPFEQIARRLLFSPNGMMDATFDHQRPTRSRAVSLDRDGKPFEHEFEILPGSGAGLEGSATDLVRFGQLHLTGRSADGRLLLSPRMLALLHSAPNGGFYGYGWGRIGAEADTELLISDGQVNGGQAMLLINPKRQVGAVVVSNAATDEVSELALAAMDMVVPRTSASFNSAVRREQAKHEARIAAFLPPASFNGQGVLLVHGRKLRIAIRSRDKHLNAVIAGQASSTEQFEQDEGFRGWVVPCPVELAACRRPHATAKLWLSRDGAGLGGQLQVTSINGQLPFVVLVSLR